jgi:predicted AlkP superfamily pyrophosphatase or phosphodiesterase
VERRYQPTLTLIYLPHLDYVLQRVGPNHPDVLRDLREVDAVCGDLIDGYRAEGVQVIVLSEYGITPVQRPIHLNRRLRAQGLLAVREELGRELLDAGASAAFAVADHQVAHVYVNDPDRLPQVRALLEATDGVAEVLDETGKQAYHLDHPRSGELVAIAEKDAWFTYYYWMDDRRAPDFARTVDIHRKPGYDPVELFFDPARKLLKARAGLTLLKRRLGYRSLLEVVPLDASLVRGSHGRAPEAPTESPVLITQRADLLEEPVVQATEVCGLLLRHLSASAHTELAPTTTAAASPAP